MSIFQKADILIPKNVDMTRWSVVACDQYTSEAGYWRRVERFVDGAPSTLHITFPEIYLEKVDNAVKIAEINRNMEQYVADDLFAVHENALVVVERTFADGSCRRGVVGAVDLEQYDYTKGSKSPVRATEGTVLERIPPRVKVRENALLELPHILLLIDDARRQCIEQIETDGLSVVYDFDLMEGGGHCKGYLLDEKQSARFLDALAQYTAEKVAAEGAQSLLFAVGDGNHSLATAKACWENLKKTLPAAALANHPARFALAELGNVHGGPAVFEPIHRVVFSCNVKRLLEKLDDYVAEHLAEDGTPLTATFAGQQKTYRLALCEGALAVGMLQDFLDQYLAENDGHIDYIHGAEVVCSLSAPPDCVGFLLPPFAVCDLFPSVQKRGALPRKTFSMGEAEQKRFYLECRRVK